MASVHAATAPRLTLLPGGQEASAPSERMAAVADLGSNSWRLVAYAYVPGGAWRSVGDLQDAVRIAEGLDASGRIGRRAIERGLDTLEVFARYCRARGIEDVDVVATSAIRDAANGPELLASAADATGFRVRALSVEEEARYGYLAAVNSTTLTDGASLDIGGGSLQLVGVEGRQATVTGSWPLGAVRVSERLLPAGEPVRRKALKRARAAVREQLSDAAWIAGTGPHLVGMGGAVRNLATAALIRRDAFPGSIQGTRLELRDLKRLIAALAELPPAQRALPGIKSGRADIVLAAALVLEAVLELGGFEAMEVTRAGLREGVYLSHHLLAGGEPLVADVRAASIRNLTLPSEHADHVARLTLQLYDSLASASVIAPSARERSLLWAAALLHDHAPALSLADGLAGYAPEEVARIEAILRSRKGGEEEARCALLVRIAEQLDRAEDQAVTAARLVPDRRALRLELEGDDRLARWSAERRVPAGAFQRAFGRELVI